MAPLEDLPAPATAKGTATRNRILDVAAERFGERGYAGTTFAELIAASGLTKGAFYFYFPSKELLAVAVLERQQLRWHEAVATRIGEVDGSGMDRIRALGPTVLAMMREDPAAASISRLSRDLSGLEAVAARVRTFTRNWIELVADLIRSAQADGDARADVDPVATAEVLCGAFEGLKDLSVVLDGPTRGGFPERAALLMAFAERILAKP